ncbi:MAG: PIN domain-containing protein [Actinobacteria bacterium]|nr:PIN domain-containing protein [Actinomycetota bacterium]
MIAPDSSVVVAALAPWHEAHAYARHALRGGRSGLIAHVALETTAVLSRMPEGHRIAPAVVIEALRQGFPARWLTLDGTRTRRALDSAVAAGVRGGALYDALIAATASHHGLRLLSADHRARRTYEALGADVTYVAPPGG